LTHQRRDVEDHTTEPSPMMVAPKMPGTDDLRTHRLDHDFAVADTWSTRTAARWSPERIISSGICN
jgi:hypothetical protein